MWRWKIERYSARIWKNFMSYLNSPGYYVQRELHERDLAAHADSILIQTLHAHLAQCYADLAREATKVPGWGRAQLSQPDSAAH